MFNDQALANLAGMPAKSLDPDMVCQTLDLRDWSLTPVVNVTQENTNHCFYLYKKS